MSVGECGREARAQLATAAVDCQTEILLLPSLLIVLIITLGDYFRLGGERKGGDCKQKPT